MTLSKSVRASTSSTAGDAADDPVLLAAVQEYLEAANIQEGENILLLTDDQSTIEEANKHHPNYNWIYLDRPRNTGVSGGWEGHIPSGDGAFDFVVAETEKKVAATCNKFVHGHSGFLGTLFQQLSIQNEKYEQANISKTVKMVKQCIYHYNNAAESAALMLIQQNNQ